MVVDMEAEKALMQKIARVLDESGASNAAHIRKLKDLSTLRSAASSSLFFSAFSKTLIPLFAFPRRTYSAERTVRFIATFASKCDFTTAFLEEFFRFLLNAATAANRTARFRACQMISEIIMRLPDDAEVSNELWDEVIECMKLRVGDKVPLVRALAVRALARFANDSENSDILDLFLEALPLEHNAEVRKMIVLSLPPSNATSVAIFDHTLDVSEVVQKQHTTFLLINFLSNIKVRTIILQRGLTDRSAAVTKECLKLLKDEWLVKCCNGDPIELLKYLDVETYELVGNLLQHLNVLCICISGESGHSILRIQLMEAEVALYWKTVCRNLQMKAQRVLPAMVSDYVELVKAHLDAVVLCRNYCKPIEYEVDEDGNKVVMGDGINLGVHAVGEFEEVLLGVVEELVQPCRREQQISCIGCTTFRDWPSLENAKSFRWMQGNPLNPMSYRNPYCFRGKACSLGCAWIATSVLAFWVLWRGSVELVKQLRFCFIKGPSSISIVDRAMGLELSSSLHENKMTFSPVNLCDMNEDWNVELLDPLYAGLNVNDWIKSDMDENESVQAILGRGLQRFFFRVRTIQAYRFITSFILEQAYNPIFRMKLKNCRASCFMMQMMQAPLYAKETKKQNENQNNERSSEGPAIRIAAEVVSFHVKKTTAQKSYVSALCRVLVLLHFRLSEQGAIKLMRRLLNRVAESAFAECEVVKELKRMAERLKAIDREPDQELSQEQANCILGRLELDLNFDVDDSMEIQPTPVSRSSRPARTRQGVRNQESSSEEELSPTSFVPKVTGAINTRSQRASKIAALTKMTANRAVRISEEDDEEQGSAVISQEDSDESDQSDE
ncbi:hypothetical protein AAG906_007804 [Vitis piasezkii]